MSDDHFEVPPSLFLDAIPAPYTTKHLAGALNLAGVPYPTALARVRSFGKVGLIQARNNVRSGTNDTRLFSIAEVGVAKILSDLQDAGVQDHEVLHEAAYGGCYAWRQGDGRKHTHAHPILAAMDGVNQGDDWLFRLDVFRSPTQRYLTSVLHAVGRSPKHDDPNDGDPSKGFLPVGSFVSYIGKNWLPLFRPLLAN